MRWLILSVCCLIQALSTMALLSWGPLAPFLIDSFHISHTQLGLFTTTVYLASLLFSLFAGWLTDRVGVRLLLSICPGAIGLCYIVFSRSSTIWQAYLIVFLIGVFYVLINPTTVKALRLWFPANIRGMAIGIKQAGVTLGAAAGAIILPGLSLIFGWREGVVMVGLLLAIGTIIGFVFYRDPPRTMLPVRTEVLHFRELRNVVRNKDLLFLSSVCAMFTAIQQAISTHLVIYLVEKRSLSPVEAGTYLLAVNIAGTIGRIGWGTVSDRIFNGQRRPVLIIIGVNTALFSLIIGLWGSTMANWLLYVVISLVGFTTYGWNGVYFAAASEMANDHLIASSIGWSLTIVYIGILIGPPLFGHLVDTTSSYGITWGIFGIASGVSILLLLPVRETK
jgi:ACS family hexuronate transporter-like MFS transporter